MMAKGRFTGIGIVIMMVAIAINLAYSPFFNASLVEEPPPPELKGDLVSVIATWHQFDMLSENGTIRPFSPVMFIIDETTLKNNTLHINLTILTFANFVPVYSLQEQIEDVEGYEFFTFDSKIALLLYKNGLVNRLAVSNGSSIKISPIQPSNAIALDFYDETLDGWAILTPTALLLTNHSIPLNEEMAEAKLIHSDILPVNSTSYWWSLTFANDSETIASTILFTANQATIERKEPKSHPAPKLQNAITEFFFDSEESVGMARLFMEKHSANWTYTIQSDDQTIQFNSTQQLEFVNIKDTIVFYPIHQMQPWYIEGLKMPMFLAVATLHPLDLLVFPFDERFTHIPERADTLMQGIPAQSGDLLLVFRASEHEEEEVALLIERKATNYQQWIIEEQEAIERHYREDPRTYLFYLNYFYWIVWPLVGYALDTYLQRKGIIGSKKPYPVQKEMPLFLRQRYYKER